MTSRAPAPPADAVSCGFPFRRPGDGRLTRVKLLANWCTSEALCRLWNKMTQGAFRWNDLEVTWRDEAVDYYAVINGLPPGERCVPEQTILFSMEPPVRGARPVDPRPFLQARDHRTHLNPIEWHLGQSYAALKAGHPVKTAMLSAVVSSRHELPGHRKRVAFLRFLESRGLPLDLYGRENAFGLASYRGPLPPHDKDAGILPYRYTFNAENHAVPNYVTEKLGDAILGECLCFYWGCPNVQEHLDPQAYVVLDLDDFEASYRRIVTAIRDDEWSRRLEAIRRAKQRILDELQFFPILERAIRDHELAEAALGCDLALERELPYLVRRHGLAAGPITRAPGAAAYLARLLPARADEAPDRTLLLVTGAEGPAAAPELTDRCVAVVIGDRPGERDTGPDAGPALVRPLFTSPVSYPCGSGRVVLPRDWLTIEEDVPVKVINLDRRPDRWARMVDGLTAAGLRRYTRVAGRDGRDVLPTDPDLDLFRGNRFGWRRGVIGCALSHLGLWRALAACPDPGAAWLILEDDVRLSADFLAQWSRRHDEAGEVDPHWDILCLGVHVDARAAGPAGALAASGAGPRPRVERLTGPLPGVLGGTFAYVLRRAGAWKLLEWIAHEGLRVPIDTFILLRLGGLSAFVVTPGIASSDHVRLRPAVDSDIQWDPTPVAGISP
jgi:GR25 family glycosyltransferase involved in LPS biosynthesis